MRTITGSIDLPGGYRALVDRGEPPTADHIRFEYEYSVVPGSRYKIRDSWGALEDYIYLGHGWSACFCGSGVIYITPSQRPHYNTSPNTGVPEETIGFLIGIVNSKHELELDFEIDAC